MAEYLVQDTNLTSVADKIRVLSGTTGTMSLDTMKTHIDDANTEVNVQTNLIEQITTALVDKTSVKTVSKYNIGVTIDSGATVTATNGEKSVTGVSSDRSCVLEVDSTGDWTVSAKIDGVDSNSRTVKVSNNFFTELDFFAANIIVSTSAGLTLTCVKDNITLTATSNSSGVATFTVHDYGDWVISTTVDGETHSKTVTVTEETDYNTSIIIASSVLDNNSWDVISAISIEGAGRNYWSVGDCKEVYLSGTMGTLALDTTIWVYILGFDHNKDKEGSGIQFGGFKAYFGSNFRDVCLCDDISSGTNGAKYFNLSHWGSSNHGGWARCDMRYDILGSTDVAPKNYGKRAASGDVGYNPSATCATNPVVDTLMSCLPAELRAVMKPITKYTDNVGGGTDTETNVSAMVDYLPLLAEFEIFGSRIYANSYEQSNQIQYEYYVAGNSKNKYKYPDDYPSDELWWSRSPHFDSTENFCDITAVGGQYNLWSNHSLGVAPAFMV